MEVTTLESLGEKIKFSLTGICPHCNRSSVCTMASIPYIEHVRYDGPPSGAYPQNAGIFRLAAVTQCQGCKGLILAVVTRKPHPISPSSHTTEPFVYVAHYPMGKPDDSIEEGIPEEIGEDFKEALRCTFVNAYKAAVCMCGRALEAACDDLKANGSTLEDKIDDLAKKGQISIPLKDLAHQIRLTRNRGAHAPKDEKQAANNPTKDHADALIAFTRQFFQHVYTMPAKLKVFAKPPVTASQP
jgi:Domain of unknown function (DUF4145)